MGKILELLSRAGFRGKNMDLPCVLRLDNRDLRVEVLEEQLSCGHVAYTVVLLFRIEERDEWVPIALLREFLLDESVELLQRAQQCVATMRAC